MIIKEISIGKSGVIPKASYSNLRPSYVMTVTLDEGEDVDEAILKCKDIVNRHFELDEYKAKVDLLQKQFKTIRLYDAPDGLKYPSITSILYYDKEWFVSKGELAQYGGMGTIIHAVFEHAIKSYQKDKVIAWKEPEEFPILQKEIGIVLNGSLGLNWKSYSYKEFGNKYIPEIGKIYCIEETVLNPEIRVGGRLDMVAEFGDKLSIVDFKTGGYDWQQPAFYGKTWGKINDKQIEQMVIFPLGKTDNKCGYAKPITETNIDGYWDEMLIKREEFKKDFDI